MLRIKYLEPKNQILKAQIKARLQFSDAERAAQAEIGHRLGRELPEEVAATAKPDTALGWFRQPIAIKLLGSRARRTHGHPRISEEMESLVVCMAENGYTLPLHGLEAQFNDNALERAIVMHGAIYVSNASIQALGRLGRSWGCPAVRLEIAKELIDNIKENRSIFIYYPDWEWLRNSKYLRCSP